MAQLELKKAQFILASASPRRAELLAALGLAFDVMPADIDETAAPAESAAALVVRLAETKAQHVATQVSAASLNAAPNVPSLPVLAADTVVLCDGSILGKPRDAAQADAMLARLSGRSHQVLTAVCVVWESDGQARSATRLSDSKVWFRAISDDERARYWLTGEPADKAGAYGIQGIGGIFVEQIVGSYTGIMGLPVAQTEELLLAAGVDTWKQRRVQRTKS